MKRFLLFAFSLISLCALYSNNIASQLEREILVLTNQQRARHNLPALIQEPGLADLARNHSRNMMRNNFFDHTDPQGLDVSRRKDRYYPQLMVSSIGENLYSITDSRRAFTAAQMVQGWMESPGHRANILASDYTHLGVGVVIQGDRCYATQNFASPIVKLISPSILDTRKRRLTLSFEYLSPRAAQGFKATIIYPDPSVKHFISENEFLQGAEFQAPRWQRNRRFTLTLDFPAGKGDYKIHFGWGNSRYQDYFTIRKR